METKKWENYEEVARDLLERFSKEFGLAKVKGKQSIKGKRSGTTWEIDAKGILEGNKGYMVVECRRYTKSRQSQAKLASLAYIIEDTGAEGGIIVSPFDLQKGASKIAENENIFIVKLTPESTPMDFSISFLGKYHIGKSLSAHVCGVEAENVKIS